MPCFVGCLALFFPRLAIVLVWLFNPAFFSSAYQTIIWPVLGLLFMPLTMLAYAWAWHHGNGSVQGFGMFIVIVAVLIDLGIMGGGASSKQVRTYRVVKRVENEAR